MVNAPRPDSGTGSAIVGSDPATQSITREGLRDGSLLKAARAQAQPGVPVHSAEEIAACLHQTLMQRPDTSDIWVFGYGSLIWNPAIDYAEKRTALLHGWRRCFCLTSGGRGSPERPGIMLGLDRGGSCGGVAFRIDEAKVNDELLILWHREMLTGAYRARWTTARTEGGRIPILTFVANRDHPRFIGHLCEAEVVARIASARGPLGSCLDYFRNTIAALEEHGIRDAFIERLSVQVEAAVTGHGNGSLGDDPTL